MLDPQHPLLHKNAEGRVGERGHALSPDEGVHPDAPQAHREQRGGGGGLPHLSGADEPKVRGAGGQDPKVQPARAHAQAEGQCGGDPQRQAEGAGEGQDVSAGRGSVLVWFTSYSQRTNRWRCNGC